MTNRPLVLISNDDGLDAEGLATTAEALRPIADIICVAPDRERSGASHAISLHHPLRVKEIRKGAFTVDGTPADCVYLGVLHLADRKPDLCISGVNHGVNLGSDVFYSGTVAAAVEGTLRGVPSFAVSLERSNPFDFASASDFVRMLAERLFADGPSRIIPPHSLLNVNIPAGLPEAFQITHLGKRVYRDMVDTRTDLRGHTYYWIGGPELPETDAPSADGTILRSGQISVTPLSLDLTDRTLLKSLTQLQLGSFLHTGPGSPDAHLENKNVR